MSNLLLRAAPAAFCFWAAALVGQVSLYHVNYARDLYVARHAQYRPESTPRGNTDYITALRTMPEERSSSEKSFSLFAGLAGLLGAGYLTSLGIQLSCPQRKPLQNNPVTPFNSNTNERGEYVG